MQSTRLRSFVLIACLAAAAPARPALGGAQTVREPAFGLPHIFADTDLELARENGREIAKDRLGAADPPRARRPRHALARPSALLDPSTLDDDIEARRTAYTSSELNNMFAKLPAARARVRPRVLQGRQRHHRRDLRAAPSRSRSR